MDIKEHQTGEYTLVELRGRLTVNDNPGRIRQAVDESVGRGVKVVVLDLSGVMYIDSTRLGELIASHVSLMRQGGALRLVRTPARIRELLQVAGLDGVFRSHDTLDDALRV
jgi:anti-sigma B factor antagonist